MFLHLTAKQVGPQKSVKKYEALTLQSIQEVSQDNGSKSEVDEGVFADSLDDKVKINTSLTLVRCNTCRSKA